MSAIESGADWWIDSFARFSGGGIGPNYRSGAMNETSAGFNPDISRMADDSDSQSSIISDIEEEGEVNETHANTDADTSHIDELLAEIQAGSSDIDASAEVVASTAANIGVIEAAMRQHPSTGMATFNNDDSTDEDPTDESFEFLLSDEMKHDPTMAFAAAIPGQDRLGILSLLSNY